jgi:hypothetical protein
VSVTRVAHFQPDAQHGRDSATRAGAAEGARPLDGGHSGQVVRLADAMRASSPGARGGTSASNRAQAVHVLAAQRDQERRRGGKRWLGSLASARSNYVVEMRQVFGQRARGGAGSCRDASL